MANNHIFNRMALEQGGCGVDLIDDTSAHAKNYYFIQFLEATVISAITYHQDFRGESLAGKTLPAGAYLSAPVTSITLTSGRVLANIAPPVND